MRLRHGVLGVGAALVALSLPGSGCSGRDKDDTGALPAGDPPRQDEALLDGGLKLTGPFQHENLALFLVRGKDAIEGRAFLTLDEALERKLLVVHESQDVNELTLDNLSEDHDIFIQRGEIVSGGKQDRVLGADLVVLSKARGVSIPSFCVESGRWSGRTGVAAECFDTNCNYVRRVAPDEAAEVGNIPSAIRRFRGQQAAVWGNVKGRQRALIGNVPDMKLPAASPSSLDLTLEDAKLKAAVKRYTDKLAPIIKGKDDVLGFAIAVNGKIDAADLYGSNALLKKLWPKLLKATAVDAIARLQKGKTSAPPTVEEVRAWLAQPRAGKAVLRTVSERLSERVKAIHVETAGDVVLDTRDEGADASIHRAYLRK